MQDLLYKYLRDDKEKQFSVRLVWHLKIPGAIKSSDFTPIKKIPNLNLAANPLRSLHLVQRYSALNVPWKLHFYSCLAPSAICAGSPPCCQNGNPSAGTSHFGEKEEVRSQILRVGEMGSNSS